MVPVAVAPEITAFVGLDSVTVKVSSGSSRVSSVVCTATVFSISSGMKVSVAADTAVKSVSAVALSPVSTDVAQFTVTVLPLTADSVTGNASVAPSTAVASPTLTVGGSSSSVIVPVAVGSDASSAFDDTPDSVSVKVSSCSSVVSPAVRTGNILVVALGAMVTVPVVDSRSAATAVSSPSIDAVQVAVTASVAASDSVTVKVTSPSSLPEASPTLSVGVDDVPSTLIFFDSRHSVHSPVEFQLL